MKLSVPLLMVLTILVLILAVAVIRRDLSESTVSSDTGAELPSDREAAKRSEARERAQAEQGVVGLDYEAMAREMGTSPSYGPAQPASPTVIGDADPDSEERMASTDECLEMMSHMREKLTPAKALPGSFSPESLARRDRRICGRVQFPRKMSRCIARAETADAIAACRKSKLPEPQADAPDLAALGEVAKEIGVEWPQVMSERQLDKLLEKAAKEALESPDTAGGGEESPSGPPQRVDGF